LPAFPDDPSSAPGDSWGAFAQKDVGQPVVTRDGQSGVLRAVGQGKSAIATADGKLVAVDNGDIRQTSGERTSEGERGKSVGNAVASDEVDSSGQSVEIGKPPVRTPLMSSPGYFRATVRALVQVEGQHAAQSFRDLGVKITNDPSGKFAIRFNWKGDVTFNLNESRLVAKAFEVAHGDHEVAAKYIRNAYREEYIHAVEALEDQAEWLRRGGQASGEDFVDYRFRKAAEIGNDIARHVDFDAGTSGKERLARIEAVTKLLRNYDSDYQRSDEYMNESGLSLWQKIKSHPTTNRVFVQEAVRQLAHFKLEQDNTETGHLQKNDGPKYQAQQRYYKGMLHQVEAGYLGDALRDEVNKTVASVKQNLAKYPSGGFVWNTPPQLAPKIWTKTSHP
jgi:hypothetical protein